MTVANTKTKKTSELLKLQMNYLNDFLKYTISLYQDHLCLSSSCARDTKNRLRIARQILISCRNSIKPLTNKQRRWLYEELNDYYYNTPDKDLSIKDKENELQIINAILKIRDFKNKQDLIRIPNNEWLAANLSQSVEIKKAMLKNGKWSENNQSMTKEDREFLKWQIEMPEEILDLMNRGIPSTITLDDLQSRWLEEELRAQKGMFEQCTHIDDESREDSLKIIDGCLRMLNPSEYR
jgi:hypothetical protein